MASDHLKFVLRQRAPGGLLPMGDGRAARVHDAAGEIVPPLVTQAPEHADRV